MIYRVSIHSEDGRVLPVLVPMQYLLAAKLCLFMRSCYQPLFQKHVHSVANILPDRQAKVCLYGELVRAIAHGHKRTSKRMPINLSLNLDQHCAGDFIRSACRARGCHSRHCEEIWDPAPPDFHDRLTGCGVTSLYANLREFFGFPEYRVLEPLAVAVLIFSLGYVVAKRIFSDGRRLIAIENELAIAREIQTSILPNGIPEINSLLFSAAYCPMTAVAGDFYEFIPVDQHRVGFLVADVSGHGVPAALIAAMIKVAMQSLVHCAHQPAEVLSGLNRILSGQLRAQLVSAAYLWLDMESGRALYSGAGHPPLLCWRQGRLDRIESNGLLIGVMPDSDYPVCEIPLSLGHRFLLYTDGLVEPENASGDPFGDYELKTLSAGISRGHPRICRTTCSQTSAAGNWHQ